MIRRKIVEKVRNYNVESVLTLESPAFLFSRLLPDKKIIVFEKEGDVMTAMERNCPKNVELFFGNIAKSAVLGVKADFVYLDFCKTWITEEENIIKMKPTIQFSKLFGITICLRVGSGRGKAHIKLEDIFEGDYQFSLIQKLQSLTNINWKIIYGESYLDSVQMVTLLLENPEVQR